MQTRSAEEKQLTLNKAFIFNVMAGIHPGIIACLDAGADVDYKLDDALCAPALCLAAKHHDMNMVVLLLDRKAKIDATAKNGATALHVAVNENLKEVVQLLISRGADVNKRRSSDGATPLKLAIASGFFDIAELLFENKADLNTRSFFGDGLMHVAVQAKADVRQSAVKWLLERQARLNDRGERDATPLNLAAQQGDEELVRLLLNAKADPNLAESDGATPLYRAAESGHVNVVKLLLQHRANAKLERKNGALKMSPLEAAKKYGCVKVIEALEEHFRQQLALDLLFLQKIQCHDLAAVEECLQQGADIYFQNEKMGPAVSEAVMANDIPITKRLLAAGAKVSVMSFSGVGLLDIAASKNYGEMVKFLLEMNAYVNQLSGDDKVSALHIAARLGHVNVVEILLAAKAKLEILSNSERMTPLHEAAMQGHDAVVELLLLKGANALARTWKQKTALALCMGAEKNALKTARHLIAAYSHIAKADNIQAIIQDIRATDIHATTLIAHFIWLFVDYPAAFTPDCKAIFIEEIRKQFSSGERDDIKLKLLSTAKEVGDYIERREYCNFALDGAQSNPLSAMLNIKRVAVGTDCKPESGKLKEFSLLRDGIEVSLTKAAVKEDRILDEQTLTDLQGTLIRAIETNRTDVITNCLEILKDAYLSRSDQRIMKLLENIDTRAHSNLVGRFNRMLSSMPEPNAPPLDAGTSALNMFASSSRSDSRSGQLSSPGSRNGYI